MIRVALVASLVPVVISCVRSPNVGPRASAAVDTLVAGHPALASLELRLGVDTTDVFAVVNGVQRKINTSVQSVSRTEDGYLAVQVSITPVGPQTDSTWFKAGSFFTQRHVEVGPDGTKRLETAGRRMSGVLTDSGGSRKVDITLEHPGFDNSIAGIIAMSLPLAAGYSAVIPSYDLDGKYSYMTVRMLGADTSANSPGPGLWILKTDYASSGREWSVTHWLTKDRKDMRWELTIGGRSMLGVARPGI